MSLSAIGGHVDSEDPIAEAAVRGATLSQFFLGDPPGWKGPKVAYAGGAEALRDAAAEAGIDLYVHAPYVLNVATSNNRIRIPSRKLLQQTLDAAATAGTVKAVAKELNPRTAGTAAPNRSASRREIRSSRLHPHWSCTLDTVGDGRAAGQSTRSGEVVSRL